MFPLGGFQVIEAWPDVVSGYNASFKFLGTWTVGVIFPGDTEHIIWRTKLLSRSETPGEALGRPERGKITGLSQLWAPQLPGWNYTPRDRSLCICGGVEVCGYPSQRQCCIFTVLLP